MVKKVNVFVVFHDTNLIKDIKENVKDNKIYIPLMVGAKDKDSEDFYNDNRGDNISYMNPYFSELTGLYWFNKHSNADIVGLCHYRRYFINRKYFGRLLTKKDILNNLEDNDIILYKGAEPLQGTNYESYPIFQGCFDEAYKIIKEDYPEYEESFNHVINGYYPISYFNMFICSKKLINEYCEWIFPILFKMYNNLGENGESDYGPRVYGVMAEYFFNVFIHHKKLRIKENNVRFTSFEHKIRFMFIKNRVFRYLYKNLYYPYFLKNRK